MSNIGVKRFVELLQKSRLLPDVLLRNALTQLKDENDGQPLADTSFVTQRLIEMELITKWQSDKLLSQKYKGFFLGKYKILEHIGTGGMSSVYLVEHMQMRQRRAIKVLPRKRVADKTYLERFYIEARASASLDHPNIVHAFDVDHDEDSQTHYLIMEYVDGRDVGKIVEQDGQVPIRDAARYIAQAAEALQFAHDEGVIHRDVKPGNLLVDKNNVVKILDMGLALFKEDEYSLTLEFNEKILGTADYLAPEQAINSHTVDHRADVYGLGCTFFFMLAGEPPFNIGSLAQRIAMHQSKHPQPISKYRDDCPPELQQVLEKMMKKDPEHRFQTCGDVNRILMAWLAGQKIQIGSSAQVISGGSGAGNSDVLESGIHSGTANAENGGESSSGSIDDTIRQSASSSSSYSKNVLNSVSFSDIVAGSEIQSDTPTMEPNTDSRKVSKPDSNVKTTIGVSPVFLVSIVLLSVFASSAFTILILDWLRMLGG